MVKRLPTSRHKLSDWHLWTAVTRSVHPLRPLEAERVEETAVPFPHKAPPVFDKHALWRGPSLPPYQPPTAPKLKTEPGQVIEPRMRRRLMRGQIEIDGTLDLHGMRQGEARAALQRFVVARVARGDRTILVITGKGLKKTDDMQIIDRGVLRAMLPVWLAEPSLAPLIAGWDVSAQGHGGEGAFYVRLRRAPR